MKDKEVMACAQTGSGKTAGFLLPIINNLLKNRKQTPAAMIGEPNYESKWISHPEAIILAPTRELAIQIAKEANIYTTKLPLKVATVYGGAAFNGQKRSAMSAHIIAATIGRFADMVEKGVIDLKSVKYFVIDEADRMLDQGFGPEVESLVAKLPKERISLMFSATFPDDVQQLSQAVLRSGYYFVTVGIVGSTNEQIKQEILRVSVIRFPPSVLNVNTL